MSKILYLVAVDGSKCSERAVERAIDLANKTQAKVKLLKVMDWSYLQPMVLEGVAPPILNQASEERNAIEKVLTPLLQKHSESGVDITTELIWGDAVTTILEQVKVLHVNMLFVGRQGRSRIADILLGSVANKLAHRAGVPIVLVP
tara:strand:- start:676 stop:1113 length:438 start_codon:yes stop_codon:yes gene_type:complete